MLQGRKRNLALIALAIAVVSVVDLRSSAAQSVQAPAWAQTGIDNPADSNILYGVLRNGMMYAIQRNMTPPGQTALRFMIKAGSEQEAKDQEGLAHFLEHMAFRGSTHVPDGEVKNTLERLGLRFGADTNASTSAQHTIFMFNLAKSDETSIDTGLMLLREIASELKIDPMIMQTEKNVVLSEERLGATPARRANQSMQSFLYGTHPFARDPIGQTSVVDKASATRMRDFYEAYYRPEKAVLVVVGDIDPKAIEAKIKTKFSNWKGKGPAGRNPDLMTVSRRAPEAKGVVGEVLTNGLLVVWPQQYRQVPDTRSEDGRRFVEMLAHMVLKERFPQLMVAAGKPFSSFNVGANRIHGVTDGAVLYLGGITNWQSSLDLGLKAVRQIVKYGVTQDEVNHVVSELRVALQTAVTSSSTRATTGLADGYIDAAFKQDVVTSPEQNLKTFEQVVKNLKPAQVNVQLRKRFSGTGPLLFFTMPSMPQGNEAAVQDAFVAALTTPVAPFVGSPIKPWPYTDFGAAGSVVERHMDDPDVVMVRFANGTRLSVKSTDFTKGQILVSVRFGHGMLDLPLDRVDASRIASDLLLGGGLKDLSFPEVRATLLGKNVNRSLTRLDSSFALNGNTNTADFNLQMQLLTATISAPGWRNDDFANSVQLLSQRLTAYGAQPLEVDNVKGAELRHSDDLRWRTPTPADVAKWKFDDARSFFDPIVTKSPLEVVVVGDISVDRAIDAVGKTIGALPAREELPETAGARKLKFPAPTPQPIELHHKGRADQGVVVLAWPTEGLEYANPRNSLTGLLLETMLKDRVLQRVRMQEGAIYTVFGELLFSHTFNDYGYIKLTVEIPPAKMATFFTEAEALAADIAANGVSDDELLRARTPLVDAAKHSQQTNSYWVSCLATAQSDPTLLPYCRSYVANLESVTAADIQAAAKKWLRSDVAWRLTITPESPTSTSSTR